MNKNNGFTLVELVVVLGFVAILVASLTPMFITFTSAGRGAWNKQMYNVQKTDDITNYSTLKNVEDTCRSMQASYRSDVESYKRYMKNGNKDIAIQVLIRANRTAITYNEYFRKNSFVWRDAIPSDINQELEVVE